MLLIQLLTQLKQRFFIHSRSCSRSIRTTTTTMWHCSRSICCMSSTCSSFFRRCFWVHTRRSHLVWRVFACNRRLWRHFLVTFQILHIQYAVLVLLKLLYSTTTTFLSGPESVFPKTIEKGIHTVHPSSCQGIISHLRQFPDSSMTQIWTVSQLWSSQSAGVWEWWRSQAVIQGAKGESKKGSTWSSSCPDKSRE